MAMKDKDKLINIIKAQAYSSSQSTEFFLYLAEQAELPKEWVYEIKGGWSEDLNRDAPRFINWAKSKNVNPNDKNTTTLGSILKALLPKVGWDDRIFIAEFIVKNALSKDKKLLEKLREDYEISDLQNNNENSPTEKKNKITIESFISKNTLERSIYDSQNANVRKKKSQIQIIGIVLVLISAPSVFFSYYHLLPLVKDEYISILNNCKIITYFFIEFSRSFIIIMWITLHFFRHLFLEEVLDIFCFRFIKITEKRNVLWTRIGLLFRKKNVLWARIGLLFLVILGCIFLVIYHFDYGPQIYLQQIKCDANICCEQIKKSYLVYIPYSFINFILIAVPVFIISLYGQQKDLIILKFAKKILIKKIKREPDKVDKIFNYLRYLYIHKLNRYIRLSLTFFGVFSFEMLISTKAASVAAIIVTITGLIFLSFTFIIIYHALTYYEDIWSKKSDPYHIDSSNSTINFFGEILKKNFVTLLAIIIILMAVMIISNMLDYFLEHSEKCS